MSTRRSLPILLMAASLGCFTIAEPVLAKGGRISRFTGGIARKGLEKAYTADTLTQAQLKECLQTEEQIDILDAAVEVSGEEIGRARTALELQQAELEADGNTLNRSSKKAVNRYNARVDEVERSRARFNELVDDHNLRFQSGKASTELYNSKCANKKYYRDDLASAKAALSESKSSAAATPSP